MDIDEIKDAIDFADKNYIKTICFYATNLSQYGIDLYKTPMLPYLVEYVESKENIKYLKLIGFSYKDAIKYNFQTTFANASKLIYVSGSLETGSPRLLEMIKKGFTKEELINFILYISSKYKKGFRFKYYIRIAY